MTSDLSFKLKQVIEQIPKDVLYDFVCLLMEKPSVDMEKYFFEKYLEV